MLRWTVGLANGVFNIRPRESVLTLAAFILWLSVACHRNVGSPTAVPTAGTQAATAPTTLAPVVPVPNNPPSLTPRPSSTPYASSLPLPTPDEQLVESYVVQYGDTLSGIGLAFDISIAELVASNDLASENDVIHVGQTLQIPLSITRTGPQMILLPDSEVVYSPAYLGFDLEAFVSQYDGYLNHLTSPVNGTHVSAVKILEQVARQNSIGSRVLLALLEHYGGWVTQAQPHSYQALGPSNLYYDETFYLQLSWAANRISEGYYGYKRKGNFPVRFSDASRAMLPAGLNAGTVGILNVLAVNGDYDTWESDARDFLDTYRRLFGDPLALAFEPVVPISLTQPPLRLPWETGETFYYTGGPHAAYLSDTGWAAVDFAPPDIVGNCFYSGLNVTAAADGRLVLADEGEVYLDLDGDGNLETGWVLLYLHVAANEDVTHGQLVSAGTPLGYASCEGGFATSSHLHLARRYNGEWIAAGGTVPLVLSGWRFDADVGQYDGTASRDGVTKTACDCSDDTMNALVGE